jgi:hypothetical protein
MKKRLSVVVLLVAGVALSAVPLRAQIATTGPAGLARQMPRIYAPHMANVSRVRNQQKKKAKQRRHKTTRTSNHQR